MKVKTKFYSLFYVIGFSFIILFPHQLYAQKRVKVTYHRVAGNEVDTTYNPRIVVASKHHLMVETPRDYSTLISTVVPEKEYLVFPEQKYYGVSEMDRLSIYFTNKIPDDSVFTFTNKTEKIIGYTCKHAKQVVFSNTIDFWYTEKIPFSATPYPSLGYLPGAVMRVMVNGVYGYQATDVEKQKGGVPIPETWGKEVSQEKYRAILTENHIKKIAVLDTVNLSFGNKIVNPSNEDSDSVFHYSKGTVALRKVTLPEVTDHTVFLQLIEKSKGDAYDRTGSVFLIDPAQSEISFLDALRDTLAMLPVFTDNSGEQYQGVVKTTNYEPPVELMRFFTPFGVGHFNDDRSVSSVQWDDSVMYEQDITQVLSAYAGQEVWIGVYIANYDRGGHDVSMRFDYHPNSQQKATEKKKIWKSNLFNTLNLMEMSGQQYARMFGNDTLEVSFEIPAGVKNLTLRYVSTGHGGWGGGDEFNQKVNEIYLNNEKVFSYIPWREDCSAFRKYNPASGNFWNGTSSSDLSRSGWCPGGATNPKYIPLPDLAPGVYTIRVIIPQGVPEGKLFSAWNVSGFLWGEIE